MELVAPAGGKTAATTPVGEVAAASPAEAEALAPAPEENTASPTEPPTPRVAEAAQPAPAAAELGETVHCIFCLEDASEEDLLQHSPCACSGALTSIHAHCLTKDIEHNLRLECPICRFPYQYKAKLEIRGFCVRAYQWIRVRRNALICVAVLPIAILLLVVGILLLDLRVPGNWAPFLYVGMGILVLLLFYSAISINELPIRVIKVSLYKPDEAQLAAFKTDTDEQTRLARERGRLGSLTQALGKGKTSTQPKTQEVLGLEFPVTLQMIADRAMPPALQALITRTNEAARLAAAEAAEQERLAALAARSQQAANSSPGVDFRA